MSAQASAAKLLPVRKVISVICLSRQEVLELAAAQKFLESVSCLRTESQDLSVSGAFVVVRAGDGLIARRLQSVDGTQVLTERGQEAHPVGDVVEEEPSEEQWKEPCAELAAGMIRGDSDHILMRELKTISERLARLQRCAIVLKTYASLRATAGSGGGLGDCHADGVRTGAEAPPGDVMERGRDLDARLYDGLRYALCTPAMQERIWEGWCRELRKWLWGPETAQVLAAHGSLEKLTSPPQASPPRQRPPWLSPRDEAGTKQDQQAPQEPDQDQQLQQHQQRQQLPQQTAQRPPQGSAQPPASDTRLDGQQPTGSGRHRSGNVLAGPPPDGSSRPAPDSVDAVLLPQRRTGAPTNAPIGRCGASAAATVAAAAVVVQPAPSTDTASAATGGAKPLPQPQQLQPGPGSSQQTGSALRGGGLQAADGGGGVSSGPAAQQEVPAPLSPSPGPHCRPAKDAPARPPPDASARTLSPSRRRGAPDGSRLRSRSRSRSPPGTPRRRPSTAQGPSVPLSSPSHQSSERAGAGSAPSRPLPTRACRSRSQSRSRCGPRSRSRSPPRTSQGSRSRSRSCSPSRRRDRQGYSSRSQSRSPRGRSGGGGSGQQTPGRGRPGSSAGTAPGLGPLGDADRRCTEAEWAAEVLRYLNSRPGRQAEVVELIRVGLGIPNHLLSGRSPSGFFHKFAKLWEVSVKGTRRGILLSARAECPADRDREREPDRDREREPEREREREPEWERERECRERDLQRLEDPWQQRGWERSSDQLPSPRSGGGGPVAPGEPRLRDRDAGLPRRRGGREDDGGGAGPGARPARTGSRGPPESPPRSSSAEAAYLSRLCSYLSTRSTGATLSELRRCDLVIPAEVLNGRGPIQWLQGQRGVLEVSESVPRVVSLVPRNAAGRSGGG